MKIDDYETGVVAIGRKLKRLRERKGFATSSAFAEEFDLPCRQYSKMEDGTANLTFKSLMKVLKIHQLSLEDFLCDDLQKAAA